MTSKRRDRLDYQLIAAAAGQDDAAGAVDRASQAAAVRLSDTDRERLIEAVITYLSLGRGGPPPSTSKAEEQILWVRKSVRELRRSLGGNTFRDHFLLMRSGPTLQDLHHTLSVLDELLVQDAKDLVKRVDHTKGEGWKRSRRAHLISASIDAATGGTETIDRSVRAFVAAIFAEVGSPFKSDAAVRMAILRTLNGT